MRPPFLKRLKGRALNPKRTAKDVVPVEAVEGGELLPAVFVLWQGEVGACIGKLPACEVYRA